MAVRIATTRAGSGSARGAGGRHEAEVVAPPGKYPNVVFDVTSEWLDRYFRRPVYVVDPTKSAAVLWEEATYVPVAQGHAPETRHELRLGEAFTSYKNVDFRFEEFPEKIKLDRKTGQTVKTRLARGRKALAPHLSEFAGEVGGGTTGTGSAKPPRGAAAWPGRAAGFGRPTGSGKQTGLSRPTGSGRSAQPPQSVRSGPRPGASKEGAANV